MRTTLKILFLFLVLYSCSMNSSLRKSFIGRDTSSLEKHFGKPTTVIPRSADSLLIFERRNALDGTEISQGRMTLDPIYTPKVTKKERFIFTVNKGKIVDTGYEKLYDK